MGNAYEEVEATREGDDVEIAFNAKYLLDVLSVLDPDSSLNLELTESLKPGVVRPIPMAPKSEVKEGENAAPVAPLEPDYLCVLMPMQIV